MFSYLIVIDVYLDFYCNTTESFNCFFTYWLHCLVCGIFVLQSGIEPVSLTAEAQNLNQGTASEIPNR